MKRIILTIASLVMIAGICVCGQQGQKAVLFTFQGFSNLGVNNVNGGIGGRYYLSDNLSLKATYGSTLSNVNTPITTVSGAALFDIGNTKNTNVYIGVTGNFEHAKEVDSYGFGGVVGAEFFAWDNLSFSGEYPIVVTHETASGVTTWKIGDTSGSLGVAIWF